MSSIVESALNFHVECSQNLIINYPIRFWIASSWSRLRNEKLVNLRFLAMLRNEKLVGYECSRLRTCSWVEFWVFFILSKFRRARSRGKVRGEMRDSFKVNSIGSFSYVLSTTPLKRIFSRIRANSRILDVWRSCMMERAIAINLESVRNW